MKNYAKTLKFFDFKEHVSLPKSTFNIPEVEFEFDLPGSVYIAVRKNDILNGFILVSPAKKADFRLYGSDFDRYIQPIIKHADLWRSLPIDFADYYHAGTDDQIVFTFDKVKRKLGYGDFSRIFLPFKWIFQFIWILGKDYYISPNSLAGAVWKSIKYDKQSNTIKVKLSGHDTIFMANFLVNRAFDIIQNLEDIYSRQDAIDDISFMLFEFLTVIRDSGDWGIVDQWLHRD